MESYQCKASAKKRLSDVFHLEIEKDGSKSMQGSNHSV
jgi:hypothetical protein